MTRNILQRLPEQYLKDFREKQLGFIKNRVRLLCSLTIFAYFALFLLDFVFQRSGHLILELTAGLFLAAAGMLALFLSGRARDLRGAKLAALSFVFMLVLTIFRVGITFYEGPVISSAIYVFSMLVVTMTIPLTPLEVVPLAVLHIGGFSAETLYIIFSRGGASYRDIASGSIFLTVAFILCVVIRRKETERDVENFVLLKTVEQKNTQMRKELEMATRVHKTIIPDGIKTDLVDIKVTYLPAYYVGGDYARYVFLPGDKITFIISDITGHGVPAALLVNRMHAEFERTAKEGLPPGELMRGLNVFIKQDFEGSGMYLTAFCGQLDLKKMTLSYSNYAHPPQYVLSPGTGHLRAMSSTSGMLGLPVQDEGSRERRLSIARGDRIFLYTDGVTETFNSSGEEFGNGRLERFFTKNCLLDTEEFERTLVKELNGFKSGDFRDDICMLDINIKGSVSFLGWHKH